MCVKLPLKSACSITVSPCEQGFSLVSSHQHCRIRCSINTDTCLDTCAYGRESSDQFLEAQVISSSVDVRLVWSQRLTPSPVGWLELCFNHPVVCCSPSLPYYSHVLPPLAVFVYRNEPCVAAAAAFYIRQ